MPFIHIRSRWFIACFICLFNRESYSRTSWNYELIWTQFNICLSCIQQALYTSCMQVVLYYVVLSFINLSYIFYGTKWIEKLGCTSYRCLNLSSTLCGWITWICPSVFLFSCSQSRNCKGNANDDHLTRLELVYSASEVERWVGVMSPQHCHIVWPQLFHIVMTVWHGTCRV